jgi:hypothetical protein
VILVIGQHGRRVDDEKGPCWSPDDAAGDYGVSVSQAVSSSGVAAQSVLAKHWRSHGAVAKVNSAHCATSVAPDIVATKWKRWVEDDRTDPRTDLKCSCSDAPRREGVKFGSWN